MNTPAYRVLVYGAALLIVLFAYADASGQEWPALAGGLSGCDTDGRPAMKVAPGVPQGSLEWTVYTVHEVAHVALIHGAGGCGPYEARMRADERTRGHPFRLLVEAIAYCSERAAGFYRGDGSLRWIALILSGSPLYRQWNWSTGEAMEVLERVCG